MKCVVCGKGLKDGIALHRQNNKGITGIWKCSTHNKKSIDPVIQVIVYLVERINREEKNATNS